MRMSALGNAYFQKQQPWKTRGEDPVRCDTALAHLVDLLLRIAVALEPFLPRTAHAIAEQLGTSLPTWDALTRTDAVDTLLLPAGHAIAAAKPLFAKLEDARTQELRARYGGAQAAPVAGPRAAAVKPAPQPTKAASPEPVTPAEAFAAVELVVGEITAIERHPNADKLFVETVDLGPRGTRTIVSGLAGHYEPEALRGKRVVIVANLAPAKLRGTVSEGMLLAAEDEHGVVGVVTTDAAPGTVLRAADEVHGAAAGHATITYDVFSRVSLAMTADGLTANGDLMTADGARLVADKGIRGHVR
jgi:methionyl-tRNA synthetase